jgi:multisubunit Na+/H+ antiporter MnhE subunit
MVLSLLLTYLFVRRKIAIKLDSQAILKSVAASVAMLGAMEAFQVWYYSRFLMPAYLLVGLLVYVVAMRFLKAVTTADIDLLRRILGPRSKEICDLLSWLVLP